MEKTVSPRTLRRRSAACGAACACLAGVPAITITHGHQLIATAAIAVQIALLVLAGSNFTRAKRAERVI